MTIYIYSSQILREPRGNLEVDLDDFLKDAGEVTGGGGGERGWNIDLEIEGATGWWPSRIADFLWNWGVPLDTYLSVYEDDWNEGDDFLWVDVYPRTDSQQA